MISNFNYDGDGAPRENTDKKESSKNEDDSLVESFNFSVDFFTEGIKNYLSDKGMQLKISSLADFVNLSVESIKSTLKEISKLFCDNLTVPKDDKKSINIETKEDGTLTLLKDKDSFGEAVLSLIDSYYAKSDDVVPKKLLKIVGPIGSYKNRLLQYVYLILFIQNLKKEINYPIFYIDCSKYEANGRKIDDDVKSLNDAIKKWEGSDPLIIFDNIRNFRCGCNYIYKKFQVADFFDKCNTIISVDVLFTFNESNKSSFSFDAKYDKAQRRYLSVSDYLNVFSISPLNLAKKEESERFIRNCLNCFFCKKNVVNKLKQTQVNGQQLWSSGNGWSVRYIREKLIDLQLVTIDAYQLKKILEIIDKLLDKKIWDKISLPDIYGEWFALDKFEDRSTLLEQAYNYEFSPDCIKNDDLKSSDWKVAREHKSALDYLVSQYYIDKIKTVINGVAVQFPKVVFSKSINRFIMPEIDEKANGLFYHITDFFQAIDPERYSVDIPELSQYAFILGRFKNGIEEEKVVSLLNSMKKTILEQYDKTTDKKLKRNFAFLLRSIFISLIFKNDKSALNEYCNLLFNNSASSNLHSEVNIGFHLDYYGDIVNQSPGRCPECEDNPNKGHNTLRKLKLDLSTKIDKNIIDMNLVIQILTFCMMLDRDGKKFDAYKEDRKVLLLKFLSLLETNTELKDYINYNVEKYLDETLNKLQQEDISRNEWLNDYYKYFGLPDVDRQGWVDRKVKNPESVAEHAYNCWLIGYIYLPLKLDNASDYDKNKILTLLLIHDIGEVEIGDIVTSLKGQPDKIAEKQAVERFLSKTAEKNEQDKLLEYWEEMSMLGCADGDAAGKKRESINSQIAKEIDYIQRVYQYFKYFVDKNIKMIASGGDRRIIENPSHDVVLANIADWLKDISDKNIKSSIGKEIRDKLIFLNPNFLKNRDLYIAFYSVKSNGFK